MRSTTSRRSSRADSRNCFAISEVETLSPVLDDMSFLARSRRWRSASLIRTERVCCCFALSDLSGGFPSSFSGLSGNRKLAFTAANTFLPFVSKHVDRIHVARYDVNPIFHGTRMKIRNAQSDPRKNPDSLRVHGLRTVVNSSGGVEVEEGGDSKNRYESFSPPRMTIFDLPLSHRESAVGTASKSNGNKRRADAGIDACVVEHRRSRGKWSVSPLWEAKILLGVLRQQGLAGKGLVNAFEKWAPRIAGCSRAEINRVYCEQTGREMSDYILVQQADKVVRYNQLPPEAEVVRRALLSPDSSRVNGYNQSEQAENPAETKGAFRSSKQHRLDDHDPNVLLSTNELASLIGFRPKT